MAYGLGGNNRLWSPLAYGLGGNKVVEERESGWERGRESEREWRERERLGREGERVRERPRR